jgi:hypothetical protein
VVGVRRRPAHHLVWVRSPSPPSKHLPASDGVRRLVCQLVCQVAGGAELELVADSCPSIVPRRGFDG